MLCACDVKMEDIVPTDTGGVTTGGASDVSGDWEGQCAFPDTIINIDMVLNQTDRDITGGVDIWFDLDKELFEYAGTAAGTVTLNMLDLTLEFSEYGALDIYATLTENDNTGDRLLGTCTDPDGTTGSLSLSP